MYRGDWLWGGMADLNGHEPFRMHEVGSDSWCRGCGLTMKAREWPAFAEQEKARRERGFHHAKEIKRRIHYDASRDASR